VLVLICLVKWICEKTTKSDGSAQGNMEFETSLNRWRFPDISNVKKSTKSNRLSSLSTGCTTILTAARVHTHLCLDCLQFTHLMKGKARSLADADLRSALRPSAAGLARLCTLLSLVCTPVSHFCLHFSSACRSAHASRNLNRHHPDACGAFRRETLPYCPRN
jgi:hypothetical protein